MSTLGFQRRNKECIKNTFIKNQDTLAVPENDRVLNDVYLAKYLPDFSLGAKSIIPCRAVSAQVKESEEQKGRDLYTDEPLVFKGLPVSEDLVQKLLGKNQTLSNSNSSSSLRLLLSSLSNSAFLINSSFWMASSALFIPSVFHLPTFDHIHYNSFLYFVTLLFAQKFIISCYVNFMLHIILIYEIGYWFL